MRLRLSSAVLLAALLGGVCSVGCGKKSRPADGELVEVLPPAVPVSTPSPVQPAAATVPALPAPEKQPAPPAPAPTPPPVAVTTPPPATPVAVAPPPVEPTPATVQPPATTPPPVGAPPPVVPIPPVVSLPPVVTQPPATPSAKDSGKPKDAEWPKEVNGRDVMAYLKDCGDPDPAMREVGLRTLPAFGPSVKKIVDKEGRNLFSRAVLKCMGENEKDTGVRTAAYATAAVMGFEDADDTKEAIRHLCIGIDKGVPGGSGRQHAVQALAAFGTKAENAVQNLIAAPVVDPAYETRRSVAFTLARIAFNESTGPNQRALTCLTSQLAADASAVVRLEALQSLALLGPPWEGRHTGGDKVPPKLDMKAVDAHVAALKKRLAPAPAKASEKSSAGLVERDKQVELWVRFVLMRFDTKEINDDNINAVARAVFHPDQGPRIQALAILSMMSDVGAKKIADIVKALGDDDLVVVQSAINTLVGLGYHSKSALNDLRKLEKHKDENIKKMAAQAVKVITDAKSPAEMMKKP